MVHPESGQARLQLAPDVAARQTALIGVVPYRVEDLAAEQQTIPNGAVLALQPVADEGLAAAAAIGVGGVEPVDAQLPGHVHEHEGLGFRLTHAVELGGAAHAAEVAAAEPERRDLETGPAERTVAQHGTAPATASSAVARSATVSGITTAPPYRSIEPDLSKCRGTTTL